MQKEEARLLVSRGHSVHCFYRHGVKPANQGRTLTRSSNVKRESWIKAGSTSTIVSG